MPKGTKVHKVYEALLRKGYSKERAARISQSITGQSLMTGKAAKHSSHNSHNSHSKMKNKKRKY